LGGYCRRRSGEDSGQHKRDEGGCTKLHVGTEVNSSNGAGLWGPRTLYLSYDTTVAAGNTPVRGVLSEIYVGVVSLYLHGGLRSSSMSGSSSESCPAPGNTSSTFNAFTTHFLDFFAAGHIAPATSTSRSRKLLGSRRLSRSVFSFQ
jgi:hypothetical protein